MLQTLDWTSESATLQKNMALGDAKHRRQVQDLFCSVQQALADCLFCLAAQGGLGKADALRLLEHMARVKPGDGSGEGVLDGVTVTLIMAFLYAIDVSAVNKVRIE